MDEIEKLLRKRKLRDRERLDTAIEALIAGNMAGFRIKRLSSTSLYRVRVGDFRIIFSIDKKKHAAQIVSVRLRDEGTYC